ncbi:DUF2975 domain-containing protein [Lachnospiraceae bacterium MD1]|uniref:DUF2975 domain-containing protein n=2 Tax=Variimorphobacter saccharofermentans TaxID=2755051 RepID=A0A839K502_9FIRM|nr:DUF2975 domain-containing protein [Variimorphobacter saccharofermentans]MBB2183751.1 DUF2975 domain-containing protein [Variimorphobacter saccharofermentans]
MNMSRSPLIRFTKLLLDFMFFSGILICITVPFIFKEAGKYFSIFKDYYIPYCVIFMIAGVFALIILWELRRMFHTVIKENPFVKENVTSLKRMGLCSFIITVIMAVRLFFVVTPAALVLVTVFVVAGLFSLVLSQVFDQAVTYKLENDLTI